MKFLFARLPSGGNQLSKKSVFVLFAVIKILIIINIIHPLNILAQPFPGDKTLTLTVTDTSINQLLTVITQTFGVSVIPSRGVTGNVSLSLVEATLDQTLDRITQAHGWVWTLDDDAIIIMTRQEFQDDQIRRVITKFFYIMYTNAQDVQNIIQPMLTTAGKIIRDDRTNMLQITDTPESLARIEQMISTIDVPIEVEVFALRYAIAADVRTQLERIKTPKGDIQVDERTNTLLVTDVQNAIEKMRIIIENLDIQTQMRVFDIRYAEPKDIEAAIKTLITRRGYIQVDNRNYKIIVDDIASNLERIARVIEALDAPTRMVFIEAEIIDMDYQTSLELGIDWSYGATWSLGADIPIIGGAWSRGIRDFFAGHTTRLGLTASAAAKAITKLGADTQLLASPRIMVKNDEEARFLVGGTQPYTVLYTQPITGTAGTTFQQFYSQVSQEYGIKLTVTPSINADGLIDMKVAIENTSAEPVTLAAGEHAFTGVRTTTSQANTFIQARDNETVVVGGLVTRGETASGTGIPILNRIPIIGPVLFGSRTKGTAKRNLLVFITPHIVAGVREDAEKVFPEAFEIYSRVTSTETDKERRERLKLERELELQQQNLNDSNIIPMEEGVAKPNISPMVEPVIPQNIPELLPSPAPPPIVTDLLNNPVDPNAGSQPVITQPTTQEQE